MKCEEERIRAIGILTKSICFNRPFKDIEAGTVHHKLMGVIDTNFCAINL